MKTLLVTQIYDGENYDVEAKQHTPKYVYEVVKVSNSVEPPISTRLSREALAAYCELDDWSVVIK